MDKITTEGYTPRYNGYFVCLNNLKLSTINYDYSRNFSPYKFARNTTSEFFYKGQVYKNAPYFDEYFKELNLKEIRKYKLDKLCL